MAKGQAAARRRGVVDALLAVTAVGVLFAGWLGFTVATGQTPRSYDVLAADAGVSAGEASYSPAQFAERYRPELSMPPGQVTPPLIGATFEVIDNPTGEAWSVVYHLVWADEVHPSGIIDALYRLYREARFGSPVRDIEYVQVDIAKESGDVIAVRFESSPGAEFNPVISAHQVSEYRCTADGTYRRVEPPEDSAALPFDGRHPQLTIATWNNLLRPTQPDDAPLGAVPTLTYLTDDQYAEGNYARRSQGEFQTVEPLRNTVLGIALFAVYLATVSVVWRVRSRRRGDDATPSRQRAARR